ncbi:MAG TPA: hypothetical protein VHW06_15830 [Streptosporangiaceae bacterium]|nr:hypothetical protein [Streptosporangiaceae bacterium]
MAPYPRYSRELLSLVAAWVSAAELSWSVRSDVAGPPRNTIRHVLLLSVDGLHQQDLA